MEYILFTRTLREFTHIMIYGQKLFKVHFNDVTILHTSENWYALLICPSICSIFNLQQSFPAVAASQV